MQSVLEVLSSAPGLWAFALLIACGLGLPPWSEEIVILGTGYFVAIYMTPNDERHPRKAHFVAICMRTGHFCMTR